MESLGFFMYIIMSSANSDSLTSALPIWKPYISLFCLIAVVRTYRTILNNNGEGGNPCLVPGATRPQLMVHMANERGALRSRQLLGAHADRVSPAASGAAAAVFISQ